MKHLVGQVTLAIVLALVAATAWADWGMNMTQGVTEVSRRVYDLHMLILIICALVGVGVFGALMYSLIRHRRSIHPEPAKFHESTTVEVIWTLVPFGILVGMAIPATQTLVAMDDTSRAAVTVKVTGYQWKWHYDYLDENVAFFSDLATPRSQIVNLEKKNENYLLEVTNNLVVPVGQKVRLLITSNDVIHAWWLPAVAVKKDAIPGFINEAWFQIDEPGVYRGQCAELCGRDHGFMPIVVEALEAEAYERWLMERSGAQRMVNRQ